MCIINIYPNQAKLLASRYPIVDIRTEGEYIDHHIPGSILIPMPYFNLIFPKIVKNRSCIIICEHGNRSTFLVMNNLSMFKKAFNVVGGISLWMKEGYEVTKGLDRNGEVWKEYVKLAKDRE